MDTGHDPRPELDGPERDKQEQDLDRREDEEGSFETYDEEGHLHEHRQSVHHVTKDA